MINNPQLSPEDERAGTAAVYCIIAANYLPFLYLDEVEDLLNDNNLMRHNVKRLFKAVDRERTLCYAELNNSLSTRYYIDFASDYAIAVNRQLEPKIEELRLLVAGVLITSGVKAHQVASYAVTVFLLSLVAENINEEWVTFLTRHPLRLGKGIVFNPKRVLSRYAPVRFSAAAKRLAEFLLGPHADNPLNFNVFPQVKKKAEEIRNFLTEFDTVHNAINKATEVSYKLETLYLPIKEAEYKALDSGRLDTLSRPLTPSLRKRIEGKTFNTINLRIGATTHTRRYILNGIQCKGDTAVFNIGGRM